MREELKKLTFRHILTFNRQINNGKTIISMLISGLWHQSNISERQVKLNLKKNCIKIDKNLIVLWRCKTSQCYGAESVFLFVQAFLP